ncbi:MAG TPA: DNA replication/repair protein RecF [Clostridiales bacterium]|nr:DNA replication/repair protein RecF [Clostridiales bacterium]
MQLRELFLKKYRNYIDLELSFHPKLNLIVGPNAQGKTNILESIFLSCTGRSHRTPRDRELIQWGSEQAFIRARVEKQTGTSEIAIRLHAREKKKVLINQSPAARLGELMGHLNSVLFSPDDLKLIKEGPSERRRFMDMELSQIRPRYFYYLQQYNRILNHRNNLLKEIQKKPSLTSTLPVWNQQLAEAGSFIILQRMHFISSLQTIAQEIHSKITHGSETLTLEYKSSIPCNSGNIEKIRDNFLKILKARQDEDIESGLTGKGCHRDDIVFQINGMDVRTFGSQGQKRTTVLSLKLSELEFMFKETGEYPLLLLDDAMSELDTGRQEMLMEYIGKVQTFITLTDMNHLPVLKDRSKRVYRIYSGNAVLDESLSF